MKRIFYYAAAIMALALLAVSCEKASQGLVLVADKTEFVADGEDEVTFTVMKDGKDITNTSGVTVCSEGTLSTCLPLPPSENGFKFSTSIAGEYIFSASYEGEHSEPVTVNAI